MVQVFASCLTILFHLFSYYLPALQTFFTLPRGSSSSQQFPFFQKTNMFISLTTPQQHSKIRPNLYPLCVSSFPVPPRVGILERSDRQGAAGTTNSQETATTAGFSSVSNSSFLLRSTNLISSLPHVATCPGKSLENSSVQRKHHNSIIKSNRQRHHPAALQRHVSCHSSISSFLLLDFPPFLSSFTFSHLPVSLLIFYISLLPSFLLL